MTGTLPSLCAELKLRGDGGVALVNSRDVAEVFEKRHDNVLRDIEVILHSSEVRDGWFREVQSEHPTVSGRFDRSFDLTRQGFTQLVFGWNGERARTFQVRYIEAFDAMEAQLNATRGAVTGTDLIQAVREIVAPLAVRFDGQDREIEYVKSTVDEMKGDVNFIKNYIIKGRRKISSATKIEHMQSVAAMGGRCPCCSTAEIVTDGKKSRFAEYDHFYENSRADIEHTWLICKPCHADLTVGRVLRRDREPEFRAYQAKRQRLRPQQRFLF